MMCDVCGCQIKEGDEREHKGQILCEDCYMDVLSPAKICDPWAVYTAKSMSGNSIVLTKMQEDILGILKKTCGTELEELAKKLDISLSDLQREIATLRHMEKVKAMMKDGKKVFCLWE